MICACCDGKDWALSQGPGSVYEIFSEHEYLDVSKAKKPRSAEDRGSYLLRLGFPRTGGEVRIPWIVPVLRSASCTEW